MGASLAALRADGGGFLSLVSVSSLFVGVNKSTAFAPDVALQNGDSAPGPDFVLCRNKEGIPTAVYKENIWDFNPYRLSAKKLNKIYFDTVFDPIDVESRLLIDEAKYILYCLIYFVGGGRIGKLSASTIANYWFVVRAMLMFCERQKHKPAVGQLTLRQLLTTPVYLASFLSENKNNHMIVRLASSLLRALILVGEDRLGYRVVSAGDLKFNRGTYYQHPVIPTRIYLGLINSLSDLLEQMYGGVDRFESFIHNFDDQYYGLQLANQSSLGVGGKTCFRPTMTDALEHHGLDKVFAGEFFVGAKDI